MSVGGEPGLCFPCSFPIKAMGRAEEGFELMIFGIVRRHSPGLGEAAFDWRALHGGHRDYRGDEPGSWMPSTYRELSSHERVMMAL
jgi:uncharacterized protein